MEKYLQDARITKIVISAVATAGILAHLIWPELKIDAITLGLVLLGVAPWLSRVFKSIKAPGGWEIEFPEIQRAFSRAEQVGLLTKSLSPAPLRQYSFQSVANEDPQLALAGLRIELETRLEKIAESHGLGKSRKSVGTLLRSLAQAQMITEAQQTVLADLLAILNSAVHGRRVEPAAAKWALEIGSELLASLERF